jgi:pyrimidine deaminase RibD-like protein
MSDGDQLGARDVEWLRRAACRAQSVPDSGRLRVGATIVSGDGRELASATSGHVGCFEHAEAKVVSRAVQAGCALSGATLYVTVEPCVYRRVTGVSCTDLLLLTELRRLVYAIADPQPNARAGGARRLRAMGWDVSQLDEDSEPVRWLRATNPGLGEPVALCPLPLVGRERQDPSVTVVHVAQVGVECLADCNDSRPNEAGSASSGARVRRR